MNSGKDRTLDRSEDEWHTLPTLLTVKSLRWHMREVSDEAVAVVTSWKVGEAEAPHEAQAAGGQATFEKSRCAWLWLAAYPALHAFPRSILSEPRRSHRCQFSNRPST